jgi:hypothetical protein
VLYSVTSTATVVKYFILFIRVNHVKQFEQFVSVLIRFVEPL